MKVFRPAVIRMHERGVSNHEISNLLGIPRTTVIDDIRRYEETGSYENRKREKTARSRRNIQRAKGMIQRNKMTKVNSTRKLAKKLGVSQNSAWKILRQDLGKTPYKLQKRQKLTADHKLKRRQRCPALLHRFSNGRHRQIVFSDEILLSVQQVGFVCFGGVHTYVFLGV